MKRRWGIYGAVAALLVIAFTYLAVLPYGQERRSATSRIVEQTAELQKLGAFTSAMPSLLEARRQLESRRIDLQSRLFARADILRLFDDLTAGAEDCGLTMVEISPPVEELLRLSEARSDTLKPLFLNLTVQLEGDYLDFGRFVEVVERAEYSRAVNRCIISGAPDGSKPLQFTLAFKALLGTREEKS
jgi:hypothetical protein